MLPICLGTFRHELCSYVTLVKTLKKLLLVFLNIVCCINECYKCCVKLKTRAFVEHVKPEKRIVVVFFTKTRRLLRVEERHCLCLN